MNYDDQPDPEHAAETPQQTAYARADALTFRDKPIAPFSPIRYAAAQTIGLHLWKLTDEERAAAVTLDGGGNLKSFVYNGIFADAVVVVFLCVCPRSDVLLGARKPREVFAKAMQWADDENVLPERESLVAILAMILVDLAASSAEAAPSKDRKSAGGNG